MPGTWQQLDSTAHGKGRGECLGLPRGRGGDSSNDCALEGPLSHWRSLSYYDSIRSSPLYVSLFQHCPLDIALHGLRFDFRTPRCWPSTLMSSLRHRVSRLPVFRKDGRSWMRACELLCRVFILASLAFDSFERCVHAAMLPSGTPTMTHLLPLHAGLLMVRENLMSSCRAARGCDSVPDDCEPRRISGGGRAPSQPSGH